MNKSSIGQNIKKKREERIWNQEELARRTGLSASYIGMIERGEKIPRLETFIRIANVLDATSDELLEGVIERGFEIRMTQYNEKIQKLTQEEQTRVYKILDVMLEQEEI